MACLRRLPATPAVLFLGALFLGALLLAPPGARATTLELESIPEDLDAWANDRYLGRTPLTGEIPPGEVVLRLAEPSGALFRSPAFDTLVTATAEETLRVRLHVGTEVAVYSEPSGLALLREGSAVGSTPLWLRVDPERPGPLTLRTPRGEVPVPLDTLLSARQWTWKGRPLGIPSLGRGEPSRWRVAGRYGMPLLAVGFAISGLLMEDAADRSYDRYLGSVDPDRLSHFYDEARRRDAWAAACWIGAEISLVSAVVAWVLPERRAPGEEER
jgi:hypothetical protein